jgi:hypothetical protein
VHCLFSGDVLSRILPPTFLSVLNSSCSHAFDREYKVYPHNLPAIIQTESLTNIFNLRFSGIANMTQLSSLLSLLRDACCTVEQEYARASKPMPSLDDTEAHPLDDQLSPIELRKAVRVIEAAAAQICALVGRPNHVIINVSRKIPPGALLTETEMCKRKLVELKNVRTGAE